MLWQGSPVKIPRIWDGIKARAVRLSLPSNNLNPSTRQILIQDDNKQRLETCVPRVGERHRHRKVHPGIRWHLLLVCYIPGKGKWRDEKEGTRGGLGDRIPFRRTGKTLPNEVSRSPYLSLSVENPESWRVLLMDTKLTRFHEQIKVVDGLVHHVD